MSFSSEIRAKLGLDTQAFSTGLQSAARRADGWAGELGNVIKRKLGAADVFRGLLQGLGIGSAQQIAEKLVAPFKAAADAAREMERATASTLAALDRELSGKRSTSENLGFADRALQREMEQLRGLQAQLAAAEGGGLNRAFSFFGTETSNVSALRAQVAEQTALVNSIGERQRAAAAKLAEEQKRDAADLFAAQKTLDEARLRRLAAEGDAQADVRLAGMKYAEALMQASRAADGTLEKVKAQAEVENRLAALRVAEETARKNKQADLERERAETERIAALRQQIAAAEMDVVRARQRISEAQADRLSFTLAEAAGGTRGNSQAQIVARRVLDLEARARRLADTGGTVTEFDSRTQRNVQLGASDFLARADALRMSSITNLSAAERDPARELKQALAEAEASLKEISAKLDPAAIR